MWCSRLGQHNVFTELSFRDTVNVSHRINNGRLWNAIYTIRYMRELYQTFTGKISQWMAENVVMFTFNTLRPRQNERHFADDIFKCIFVNENVWIWVKISLKSVSMGPINNIPALVQIMAWRRPGDRPLSEPMMVSLPTRICVTRPQWVNQVRTSFATKRHCFVCQIVITRVN